LQDAIAGLKIGMGAFNDLGELKPDTIDDTFVKIGDPVREQLRQEATYGLSPLMMNLGYRKNELNRRAQTQNIIANTGHDAGATLANLGAATIQADDANNDLMERSEKLRYAKLRGYKGAMDDKASLLKDKNELSNRIYDKYAARFDKAENIYGADVGTGLDMLVKNANYRAALKEQSRRQKAKDDSYFNEETQTS